MDRLPTDNLERALIEIDLFRLNFRAKVKNIKSRDDVEPQLFAFSPLIVQCFFVPNFLLSCRKALHWLILIGRHLLPLPTTL